MGKARDIVDLDRFWHTHESVDGGFEPIKSISGADLDKRLKAQRQRIMALEEKLGDLYMIVNALENTNKTNNIDVTRLIEIERRLALLDAVKDHWGAEISCIRSDVKTLFLVLEQAKLLPDD